MQYVSFCDWLTLLSIMPLMFICIAMCHDFLLFKGYIIFHYMCMPNFYVHSPIDGHLEGFLLLAIVNNVMNMDVQISLGDPALKFF